MKKTSDVIVIGGGPSGSFTAFKLAQLDVEVTVYEEHSEIGVPSHCPGHLSIKGLTRLGMYPLPIEIVENVFRGASFYSPNGNRFSVHLTSPVTCAVDRARFDKYIAEKAQDAGANYCLSSRVENLIIQDGAVKGVTVTQQGKTQKMLSKIVVDAEGISSRLLKETGLLRLNRHMLVNGVEAEVENIKDTQPDAVEVYLGTEYAPGFYAWLIPKKNERAKIGLATKAGNPKQFLQKLMVKHPVASKKLQNAKISRTTVHPITLGGPIHKAYSHGFLAVGDAASQVKSTTGGGVVFGMTCATIAAEVASQAIRQSNFSLDCLSAYQQKCNETMGFDAKMMVRIRRTLDVMSDATLDSLIGLCSRVKLEKTLQNVEDIDFQGRTLLRALRSPRMLAALGYFVFAYLFANL